MININEIIENMPKGLSQLEKARYIYLELGKIFSYNIEYIYTPYYRILQDIYDEKITLERINNGEYENKIKLVCKQASEILCEVLNKIGIKSYCIGYETRELNHIDVIAKIENKNFCLNIIGDLKNTQKGFFTKEFGKKDKILPSGNKCDIIDDEETKRIDTKLGYCKNNMYTDDVIEMLKKEMKDDDNFKKFISEKYPNIKKDTLKEDTLLQYKVDFIYKYIKNNMIERDKMEILELSQYYKYIFKKILTPNENIKRNEYAFYYNDNGKIKYSMISELNLDNKKVYYIYDDRQRCFVNITEKNLKNKSKDMNFFSEMPEVIDKDDDYIR